jgi:thiol:disulfide interchange protein DsbD
MRLGRLGTLLWVAIALLLSALPAGAAESGSAARFETEVLARGLLVTFGLAFAYGLGAVFNGCVYPLIPITLSVIGARGAVTRRRAFANAGLYVLGMAVMYTALGVLAAMLGKIFGFSYQNPYLMGFVVVVFLAMGLSLFGVWELRLPTQWTQRLTSGRGRALSIFFMGVVAGIVAAPCTAPFVFNLLAYVAKTRDVALGASTLFFFSLGLGLPFLVLGIFSGALASLPKSGAWLQCVKYAFGAVMIGFGLYYLRYVVGSELAPIVGGGVLVLLGAVAAIEIKPQVWTDRLLRYGGAATLALGLAYFGYGVAMASRGFYSPPTRTAARGASSSIEWLTSERSAVAQAKAQQKPVLLDFWATWCESCVELEEQVLTHPEVVAEAKRFVAVKVDSTKVSPRISALHRKYGIQGLPALVLLDRSGSPVVTITEKLPPEEFAERMREVRCLGTPTPGC